MEELPGMCLELGARDPKLLELWHVRMQHSGDGRKGQRMQNANSVLLESCPLGVSNKLSNIIWQLQPKWSSEGNTPAKHRALAIHPLPTDPNGHKLEAGKNLDIQAQVDRHQPEQDTQLIKDSKELLNRRVFKEQPLAAGKQSSER